MTAIAYIALGSNVGSREEWLQLARDEIASLQETRILAESGIEETAPIGPVPQGPYLNQMLAVETGLPPTRLFSELQRIERLAGRERGVRWGPRTLDLDLVMLEGQALADGTLTVPHPELPNRDFWQRELAELKDLIDG